MTYMLSLNHISVLGPKCCEVYHAVHNAVQTPIRELPRTCFHVVIASPPASCCDATVGGWALCQSPRLKENSAVSSVSSTMQNQRTSHRCIHP
jgi:hypothetical protein